MLLNQTKSEQINQMNNNRKWMSYLRKLGTTEDSFKNMIISRRRIQQKKEYLCQNSNKKKEIPLKRGLNGYLNNHTKHLTFFDDMYWIQNS